MGKFYVITVIAALLACLTGCGAKEEAESTAQPRELTGVMVPAAEVRSISLDATDAEAQCLLGNTYFYVNRSWTKDENGKNKARITFCQRDLEKYDEEQVLLTQEEGSLVRRTTLDGNANLYELFFSQEGYDRTYFVGKWNRQGEQVYAAPITEVTAEELNEVAGCVADAKGRLCLYTWSGRLFFFDDAGRLAGQAESGMALAENGQFVTAADEIYWYQNLGETLDFYLLDMESGSITQKESWKGEASDTGFAKALGSEEGIWVATDRSLCKYDARTGEREEVLSFGNTYINLDGGNLCLLGARESGELQLLFHEIKGYGYAIYERAVISWVDEGLLPKKETVTVGVSSRSGVLEIEESIRQFNRQSPNYAIERVYYFPRDESNGEIMANVYTDILKGTAPDLIDVRVMDIASLADKGIFEDLEPYFKNSSVVKKKDILEKVWQEGQLGGKFRVVSPFFGMSTCVTHDTEGGQGWTFEEYVRYAAEYPDRPLLSTMSYQNALSNALHLGMGSFVDYEEKKCFFTDEAFIGLLEGIREMNVTQLFTGIGSININEYYESFRDGEFLMNDIRFNSMGEFQKLQRQYGAASGWKGYPSLSGQPCHVMFSQWSLVMNSASVHKEGAWAFLEFLLSEEMQSQEWISYSNFPVRKENFQEYIREVPEDGETATKQDIDLLTEMVNDSYLSKTGIDDDIRWIVYEESGAFFAGDKSAAEAAEVIQNRAQLYLEETGN